MSKSWSIEIMRFRRQKYSYATPPGCRTLHNGVPIHRFHNAATRAMLGAGACTPGPAPKPRSLAPPRSPEQC